MLDKSADDCTLRREFARCQVDPRSQLLLVAHGLPDDVHAGALVDTESACQILGIHVELDPRIPAAPELGERMVEKSQGDPALAPCRSNAEVLNVAARTARPGCPR